ncbi:MAG: cysteine desulfurase family protein [Clostridiales bacterium]|nr:cysteine desulfurase family protein [Clostridiales bacterium]
MIYLDNSATTKVCPEAARAALEAMTECYGNPSSGHAMGRAAGELLSTSRDKIARAIGAAREEIFFTSGGTEADNWAIICGARHNARVGKHVITTAVEHDAVLKSMKELEKLGFDVEYIKPDGDGNIPAQRFIDAIRPDTALISVMMVNNETGCVFPVADIARGIRLKKSRALLHVDAVQGFLKLPFKVKTLGADMISLSSHKVHGPKGVGALYVKKELHLPPLLVGGGQESGYRSGTEGIPGIAGFAAAVEAGIRNMSGNIAHMQELKERLKELLSENLPESVIIGAGAAPHILSLSMPGYKSEVMMNYLDARGICVSKGSACKRGKRSHVLEAMGLSNDVMDGSLRVSLCPENTLEEIQIFVEALADARAELYTALR